MYSSSVSKMISAQSKIDNVVVATMNANIPDASSSGNITSNINIVNKTVYATHAEEVKADIDEFNTEVYGITR